VTQNAKIHLVGSIPLDSPEAVFRALSGTVGANAPRYPDGETGPRSSWLNWQRKAFEQSPGFRISAALLPEFTRNEPMAKPRVFFELDRAEPSPRLARLGYAGFAIESFAIFRRLKTEGVIPAQTRLQVSMPTPFAIINGYMEGRSRVQAEPLIEGAMKQEVDEMAAAIPASELAIQWDVATEVIAQEGGYEVHVADPLRDGVERICRALGWVPRDVQAGIHLCYGDLAHKHVLQPRDLATCVAFANAISAGSPRRVDWLHMPVPRARSDDAYFAPLRDLRLPRETELYLGLLHYTDGLQGARLRLEAANRVAGSFGLATECGFGRRDPATIRPLLELHRQAAVSLR